MSWDPECTVVLMCLLEDIRSNRVHRTSDSTPHRNHIPTVLLLLSENSWLISPQKMSLFQIFKKQYKAHPGCGLAQRSLWPLSPKYGHHTQPFRVFFPSSPFKPASLISECVPLFSAIYCLEHPQKKAASYPLFSFFVHKKETISPH